MANVAGQVLHCTMLLILKCSNHPTRAINKVPLAACNVNTYLLCWLA